ncbi:DNA adenine methylase [Coleofasciculus sp. FACHB-SPT36]|uniref:DNA adenine methylase n=1 Tax=Cyanophyceae TaxID=3028117 RepID=UPI00168B78B2|nr:DNA adenine methylase [Coleofasciculus sp. FACHB-SPT36]MBD2537924.1 DNA adenine methylase [Coleofasciculus sp. FACHB-SPT36]
MSTQATQQEIARPFLKWAGGKSQLIQQYIPYFPPKFTTYYEPFLGGGALFFHLLPKVSILTDINGELVNVFRCVRDEVEPLIEFLHQHQMNHSKEYYYCVRLMQPSTPLERASRFIYLNKTCFNGLYRENSKGQFNVPIGKYKNPKICNPALLRSVSAALQSALIDVQPFEAVLQSAENAEDFVFFDPPYYPLSPTSNFTAYSRHSFNEADQIRLRDVFVELAKRGVKVMLSNSDCLFIREIYSNFNIYEISASRMINSNARKRGKISELLITSYAR